MSETDFSSSMDMAEINHIQYELEYTEGISQQMRIPSRLKIGPNSSDDQHGPLLEAPHSTMMHVPERIVVAGDGSDAHFNRPRDLDLIQSTPVESVELKAPPRVLTLQDQPLDFLEPEHPATSSAPQKEEVYAHSRSRRERCMTENSTVRQNGQINKYDVTSLSPGAPLRACPPLVAPDDLQSLDTASGVLSYIQCTTRRACEQLLAMLDDGRRRTALVTFDASLESTPDDASLVDAAALRRQIVKLNRRLQLLEQENKERTKREVVMYSITVAFWLVNTWIWLRR
ncbi:mitochondrial fission factor homolog A isoform X2 [Electrophorus electricus]|uniref:mitochondrial fission factor homolog A isoform X2 n=1 Tax=Electrophorus electricus TaxID=8005 RepID=UPI0015D05F68|nr:mitochondrial fission factor homolog A isoform X2 [Electrophorus electricus]